MILLVDDNASVLCTLARALRLAGHQPIEAQDAQQAETLIAGRQIAAIVADLGLPGIGGLELIGRVRKKLPGLPAILMSGDILDVADLKEKGDVVALEKPFSVDEFLAAVDEILRMPQAS